MRRLGLTFTIALLVAPGAGAAERAQPLVDRAPARATFADRVLTGEPVARIARVRDARVYRTAGGIPVRVAFTDALEPSDVVAQSYVDFLGGLPHGRELADLTVVLAHPGEVQAMCGSDEQETLACYSGRDELMIVPAQEIAVEEGVSTAYVVAHEYGHHVAANRDNVPFPALEYGPKRWASAARVCDLALAGRIAPGDQGAHYFANPGEAWAEVYAQLKYPGLRWRFIGLLEPGDAAVQAALQDVIAPWTRRVATRFSGRFTRRGRDVRRHTFLLSLDGPLTIELDAPRRARYELRVVAQGREQARTSGRRVRFRAACRERSEETVAVQVIRRAGGGRYALTVRYAG